MHNSWSSRNLNEYQWDSAIKINKLLIHMTGMNPQAYDEWKTQSMNDYMPGGTMFVKYKNKQSPPTMVEIRVETDLESRVWLAGSVSYLPCCCGKIPVRRNWRKERFIGADNSRVWVLEVGNLGNHIWRQLLILYSQPGREGGEGCSACILFIWSGN